MYCSLPNDVLPFSIDYFSSDSSDSNQSKTIQETKPKKIAVSLDFQVKYKTEVQFLIFFLNETRNFRFADTGSTMGIATMEKMYFFNVCLISNKFF